MLTNGLEIQSMLVPIRGGVFLMGSDDGADNERPIHRVWLNAFELGRFQVTNAEYEVFTGATGHREPSHRNDPELNDPQQPVVGISWFDAISYCDWLSRTTGRDCRLPTEAEWEFAARGGEEGVRYPWGDAVPDWHAEAGAPLRGPVRVGQRPPNTFGLHEMCENVHEWCSDWYAPDYYAVSASHNPSGPETGSRRASRGGSWRHQIPFSRCASRSSIPPGFRYTDYGFRIASDSPAPTV